MSSFFFIRNSTYIFTVLKLTSETIVLIRLEFSGGRCILLNSKTNER